MLDKIDPEVKDLLELLDSLTEDQLATAHLLMAHFVELQCLAPTMLISSPTISDYKSRIAIFLKEIRLQMEPQMITHYGALATYSLSDVLMEIFSWTSRKKSVFNADTLLEIIKKLLVDYQNVFGNETFKDYFYDLTFRDKHIFSRRASDLIMRKLYESELGDSWDSVEDEEGDPVKDMVKKYRQSWEGLSDIFASMSSVRFLLFNAVSLLLSRRCFEGKTFIKYRKHVSQAVKKYIESEGVRIKIVSIMYMRDIAIPRMKATALEEIEKGTEAQDKVAQKYELFTMATDMLLKDVSKIKEEEAHQILMELIRNKEEIFTSPKLESYALTYYKAAQDEYDKRAKALQEQLYPKVKHGVTSVVCKDQNEDLEPTQDQDQDSLKELDITVKFDAQLLGDAFKKLTEILDSLENRLALFFHVLATNILVERKYPREKYLEYIEKTRASIISFKGHRPQEILTEDRKTTDEEFKKVFQDIIQQLQSDELKNDPYQYLSLLITANAIDFALEDMGKLDPDTLKDILIHLAQSKTIGGYSSDLIKAYVLRYLIRSNKDIEENCVVYYDDEEYKKQ